MKRSLVIGVAVGTAVAITAAGVAWWTLSRPTAADAVVKQYLGALASGDADAALALFDAPPPGGDDLTDALAGATGLLSGPSIEHISSADSGDMRADVSFDLAGSHRTASFTLVQSDSGWRLTADALGAITASTTVGDSVAVGSVVIPAAEPAPFLPAAYTVTAAPGGILDGEAEAVVLPGTTTDAAVEASLSPAATARAQAQLDAYAEQCAAATDAVPEHCGLRVPWAADLASLETIALRIEQEPALVLSSDLGSFEATGGAIVATVRGTARDGASAVFTYRTEGWALRGTISFEGDEIVLSVR
ncbi:hypothetical protein AB1K54_03820 [Microbacterium sp. BWT-B31]|uniref:hypothetical protein n=1 Tax=Microbacterium sp. BWT-B31 TaxID=3232072 RepID=UPI003528D87C